MSDDRLGILIVDDDEGMWETLSGVLTDKGYRTLSVDSGQEAMDTLRDYRFEVAIIDISLPDRNGIELLQEIKAVFPTLTAVLITGHSAGDEQVSRMALAGADEVMYKPFDTGALVRSIEKRHPPPYP